MRIRALSVFEGVIYHSVVIDPSRPERPTLEVEARVGEGDVDAGPLLLPLAEFVTMAGGPDAARSSVAALDTAGRLVDHLDVPHVAFPFWEPVTLDH